MKKVLFLFAFVSVAWMSYAQLPPIGGEITPEEEATFQTIVDTYWTAGEGWEDVWNDALLNSHFANDDMVTKSKFTSWFNLNVSAGTSPVGSLALPMILLLLIYGGFLLFRHKKTAAVMALLVVGLAAYADIPTSVNVADRHTETVCAPATALPAYITITVAAGDMPDVYLRDFRCGENAYPEGDAFVEFLNKYQLMLPLSMTYFLVKNSATEYVLQIPDLNSMLNSAIQEYTITISAKEDDGTGPGIEGESCATARSMEAGYSAVLDAGEYWFKSTTYYLPIYLTIYPEDMNNTPEVTMDLACDGNYSGAIENYKNLLETMSPQYFGKQLTFPLSMNNELFQKEEKDKQGNTIGYVFDFPSTFRELLMGDGVMEYAPAYVKVELTGRSRVLIQSGLDKSCRDEYPKIQANTYIPVSNEAKFMFPIGEWLGKGYQFEWTGENEAQVYIATDCDPSISNNRKSFILPNEIAKVYPSENTQMVSDYGTEMYLKCVTTGEGYLKMTEIPEEIEYYIVEYNIAGIKALINHSDKKITATIPKNMDKAEAFNGATWKIETTDGKASSYYVTWEEENSKYYANITDKNGSTLKRYQLAVNNAPVEGSTDNSLSNIQVDGHTISGFSPYTQTYRDVEITNITTLTATATSNEATVTISSELTAESPLPQTVTITVSAPGGGGVNNRVYVVHLIAPRSNDASLSDLKVNGITITDFSPSTYKYTLQDLEELPEITYTKNYSTANARIEEAERLPGYTQVIVTAEDGKEEAAYTVFMYPKEKEYSFTAYGKVTVKSEPLAAGNVFADTSEGLTPEYSSGSVELTLEATESSKKMQPASVDTEFFTWAKENAGYYFEGWNIDQNNADYYLSKTSHASFIETIRSSTEETPTNLPTYYAHFRHPEVIDGGIVSIEIGTADNVKGRIPFTVKNVKATGELKLTLPAASAGISFDEVILDGEQYIIPFTITPEASTQVLNITLASYDDYPENSKSATLNITKLNSELATFTVNGSAGHNNISLSWEPVAGATQYEIRQNGVTKATVTETTYATSGLTIGATYEYSVVAKNSSSTPTAVGKKTLTTGVITSATAESFTLELPYYATFNTNAKTINTEAASITNLSHLFSGTQTIMDTLYLLVDNENPENAVCYVYAANATKNEYAVEDVFNPHSHCRVLNDFNNKKLYFSGSCLDAYTGFSDESEGFFYFKGTSNSTGEQVDIYFENLTITTAQKNVITKTYTIFDALGWDGHLFFNGGSSVFAFYSNTPNTTTPVKANFHVKGKSELRGNQGCSFELYGPHPLVSAPIASRPTEEDGNCITFTFDDKWGETRTNGWLGFRSQPNAPSIDLGNEKGKVIFNGGQYRLWGSGKVKGPKSTGYGTTLAISYRHYSFLTVSVYGFGSDVATGLGVHIYDGTFSSYTKSEGSTAYEGWEANIYRTPEDIRLPMKSTINGGTFNDNAAVYVCNNNSDLGSLPLNEAGHSLCRYEVEWDKSIPADGTPLQIDLANDFEYDLSGLVTFKNDEPSAITGSKQYGANGLNVGTDGKLYLYVNIETLAAAQGKEVDCTLPKYENWAVAFPAIQIKGGSIEMLGSMSMGGDVTIQEPSAASGIKPTAYVAYVELDDLTLQKGNMEYQDENVKVAEFTNPNGPKVQKAVYMIMPIMSNVNYQLIPPFDVHKIYVIEQPSVVEEMGTEAYQNALATANFNMFNALMSHIAPKSGTSNAGSLREILLNPSLVSPTPRLSEAIPYNPAVSAQDEEHAHFFMYESKDRGLWKLDEPTGYNWDYLIYDPTGETPLMKAPVYDRNMPFDGGTGAMHYKVYFLHFPSNNKFWDNRYIVLEGKGEQTLSGKNDLDIEEPDFGNGSIVGGEYGQLMGNYTFSRYTTEENGYYLYNSTTKKFVQNESHGDLILPGRTFMTINHSGPASIMSFDLDGNITYVGETTDGLNTLEKYPIIVTGGENTLTIQTLQAQEVTIYNVEGQLITTLQMGTSEIQTLPVCAGVYIISAGGNTQKAIVR